MEMQLLICWCRKKDFNASISIFAPSWMIRSTGQTTLNFELVGSIPARGGSGCETTLWTWQNEYFQSNLDSFRSPFELVNYFNSYFMESELELGGRVDRGNAIYAPHLTMGALNLLLSLSIAEEQNISINNLVTVLWSVLSLCGIWYQL